MKYNHTQKAPLHYIFYPVVIWLWVLAWMSRERPPVAVGAAVGGLVLLLVAFMFRQLTVRDEGKYLAVRFGPLALFGTRIAYADISSVEAGRSSLIDGWGMHYIPGRGSTYNIWGFACAKLTVKGKTVRIGSDDVANLVASIQQKLAK